MGKKRAAPFGAPQVLAASPQYQRLRAAPLAGRHCCRRTQQTAACAIELGLGMVGLSIDSTGLTLE